MVEFRRPANPIVVGALWVLLLIVAAALGAVFAITTNAGDFANRYF